MSRFEVITHEPPVVDAPTPQIQGDQSVPPSGGSRFEVIEHEPVDRGTQPDISPENRFKVIRNQQERIQPSPKNRDPSKFDPDSFDWGQFGLKPSLLKSVAKIESNFKPGILSQPDKIDPKTGKERPADVRAAGLMQMRKPAWIDANKWAGTDYPLSARFDPKINAKLGSVYLKKMIERAGGDTRTGLAMYYAGEGGYRSNPKLRREGQEYANKILKQQLQFEQEHLRQQAKEKLATKSDTERAGLAALEGVGSAVAAPLMLPVLAMDLGKWGLGHDDAFQMSKNFARNLEIIPDEEKSMLERAISYGVSSMSLGGATRISTTAGSVLDNFFDVVTSPFVKRNVAGGAVGATVGVTDHYSRDTMFEGWSPLVTGVAGALALRNVGNDNVLRAFEGTTKRPGDVLGREVTSALDNTPQPIVGELTTPQLIGDPSLARLQNRIAMYDPVGGELSQVLQEQSRRIHKKGTQAFPGQRDAILDRLQREATDVEDTLARAIGNPSRVEGEIELKNFLDSNKFKLANARNIMYEKAKPHLIRVDVEPIEDLVEGIRQRASTEDWLVKPVAAIKKALFEEVTYPPETPKGKPKKVLELKHDTTLGGLQNAWKALSDGDNWKDPELQQISEYLKNMAVSPTLNPDGHEFVATANRFYNLEQDIYRPYASNKQRVSSTLLSREAEGKPMGGRTGISKYEDVQDIRRLTLPTTDISGEEWRAATTEQVNKALGGAIEGQLSEAARDPVSGRLQPGKANEYLAAKKEMIDASQFDAGSVPALDSRFSELSGALDTFETMGIKEATFNVIANPRKFNQFVETAKKYGATGKQDFSRLGAIAILDEMFPENVARSAAAPGAREVSAYNPGEFLDTLQASRMLDKDQRQFLKALNQARAGIYDSKAVGEMSDEQLKLAVPNGILARIVRGMYNTATGNPSEMSTAMGRRDARLLAAALHDPKIARKVLNVPRSWAGVDVWYKNMEGEMNNWQRRFTRDLQRGGIVARKTDELMRRLGLKQYLMEELRTDREMGGGKDVSAAWERIGGVFQ